eukprot:755517-Hanusia_phi.AAC.2
MLLSEAALSGAGPQPGPRVRSRSPPAPPAGPRRPGTDRRRPGSDRPGSRFTVRSPYGPIACCPAPVRSPVPSSSRTSRT